MTIMSPSLSASEAPQTLGPFAAFSADITKNSFYHSSKVPGINRMSAAFSLAQWIPQNPPNSHNDQVSQSVAVLDVWLALLLILPPPINVYYLYCSICKYWCRTEVWLAAPVQLLSHEKEKCVHAWLVLQLLVLLIDNCIELALNHPDQPVHKVTTAT